MCILCGKVWNMPNQFKEVKRTHIDSKGLKWLKSNQSEWKELKSKYRTFQLQPTSSTYSFLIVSLPLSSFLSPSHFVVYWLYGRSRKISMLSSGDVDMSRRLLPNGVDDVDDVHLMVSTRAHFSPTLSTFPAHLPLPVQRLIVVHTYEAETG